MHGGKNIIFEQDALFDVKMNNSEHRPHVYFLRKGDTTKNVEIVIGKNSALGFMASNKAEDETAKETGSFVFDPTNIGFGRMVLRIKNKGGFIITGQHTVGNGKSYTINELKRTVLAGKKASVEIINSSDDQNAHAGLLVITKIGHFLLF